MTTRKKRQPPASEGGWTEIDMLALVVNPVYAIEIDEDLLFEHEPLVSEDQWVAANVNLIEQMGAEAWLRELLSVLKGNYQ